MDLMQIVRDNPRARAIILDMNVAVIASKYGIKLSQAQSLQNYAAILDMAGQQVSLNK
jgi:hypothetical protein